MALLSDLALIADAGGSEWLRSHRLEQAELLETIDEPSDDDEVWRYSPIRQLDVSQYTAPPERTGPVEALDPAGAAARVVIGDGQVRGIGVSDSSAGLAVVSGREADGAPIPVPRADEFVAALAGALTSDPVFVDIAPGATVDAPIVIEHEVSTDRALVGSHVVIRAGADSDATVVERRQSASESALVVPLVDLLVDDAARLRHVDAQMLSPTTWQLGQQRARVGAQATLAMYQAGLGGAYARMRTDCELAGRGATGTLAAVYFGREAQTLDYRTFQDHAAPDTSSNLLFKGAVDDNARSIYSGLIRVRPEARGTVAFQTNRNIKLAETAWAESVPNLEIENNDVRCSHASTVGPIDEDQRFYLESRGVRPAEAERLILAGFFDEVLGTFPDPTLAAELTNRIAARLETVAS